MKLISLSGLWKLLFFFPIRSKTSEETSIPVRNFEATLRKQMRQNVWYRSE